MENNQREQQNANINQDSKKPVQNPSEGTQKNFGSEQNREGAQTGTQKNDTLSGDKGTTRQ